MKYLSADINKNKPKRNKITTFWILFERHKAEKLCRFGIRINNKNARDKINYHFLFRYVHIVINIEDKKGKTIQV